MHILNHQKIIAKQKTKITKSVYKNMFGRIKWPISGLVFINNYSRRQMWHMTELKVEIQVFKDMWF